MSGDIEDNLDDLFCKLQRLCEKIQASVQFQYLVRSDYWKQGFDSSIRLVKNFQIFKNLITVDEFLELAIRGYIDKGKT